MLAGASRKSMVGYATLVVMGSAALAVEPPIFNPPTGIFLGAGTNPSSAVFSDFDGDGDTDGAITLFTTNEIQLIRQTGAGFVLTAVFPTTGVEPMSLLTADFNMDGWTDLAWLNHASSEIAVARNAGTGSLGTSFPAIDIYPAPAFCHALTSGDFDGDGFDDLAAADYVGHQVVTRRNNGTGLFPGGMLAYGLPPIGGLAPQDIAARDLNGDSILDLLTANATSNNVSVLLGTAVGTFAPLASFPTGGVEPLSLTAADFDADGKIDVAAACRVTDDINILLNGGAGILLPPIPYWLNSAGTEDAPRDIDSSDLDCDGDVDLITANELSSNVSVLTNDGKGMFVQQSPEVTGIDPKFVIIEDLDGGTTGLPEVVSANFAGDSLTLFGNVTSCGCEGDANGDATVDPLDLGYVSSRFGCPVGSGMPDCDSADVNGDGTVDPLDIGFTASRFGTCP